MKTIILILLAICLYSCIHTLDGKSSPKVIVTEEFRGTETCKKINVTDGATYLLFNINGTQKSYCIGNGTFAVPVDYCETLVKMATP